MKVLQGYFANAQERRWNKLNELDQSLYFIIMCFGICPVFFVNLPQSYVIQLQS